MDLLIQPNLFVRQCIIPSWTWNGTTSRPQNHRRPAKRPHPLMVVPRLRKFTPEVEAKRPRLSESFTSAEISTPIVHWNPCASFPCPEPDPVRLPPLQMNADARDIPLPEDDDSWFKDDDEPCPVAEEPEPYVDPDPWIEPTNPKALDLEFTHPWLVRRKRKLGQEPIEFFSRDRVQWCFDNVTEHDNNQPDPPAPPNSTVLPEYHWPLVPSELLNTPIPDYESDDDKRIRRTLSCTPRHQIKENFYPGSPSYSPPSLLENERSLQGSPFETLLSPPPSPTALETQKSPIAADLVPTEFVWPSELTFSTQLTSDHQPPVFIHRSVGASEPTPTLQSLVTAAAFLAGAQRRCWS